MTGLVVDECGESTKRTSLPDLKIKNFKKLDLSIWDIKIKYYLCNQINETTKNFEL